MVTTRALRSRALSLPCSDVMRLLADGTRLRIVELLTERALSVRSLKDVLGIEPTLLSHHLRVLRDAALIEGRRDGRHVTYRLTPLVLSAARKGELDFGCCRLSFDRTPGRGQ